MARKPKTQPSTKAAAAVSVPELTSVSAPRGRKPKAAAPSPASLAAASIDDPATDGVEADAATASPVKKAPGRRGPGRQPKTQPSPEVAATVPVAELAAPDKAFAPARRGRKPKAAAPSPLLALAVRDDDRATDAAGAGAAKAGPTRTPGRKGSGRKQKQAAGAMANPSVAGLEQVSAEDNALMAERAVSLDDAGTDGAAHGGAPADEAARGAVPASTGPEAAARTASAARWDRATDGVRFDWPEIERVASADGPNQGMAKLLVAARAEGAVSRWPL